MPIECSVALTPVGQEEFHALDKRVMGEAFAIHNTLGRFCDEVVYQEELARRCKAIGLHAQREVTIRVSHKGFVKGYYLDLLIEGGIVYELKTVKALNGDHQKQVINYLHLTQLKNGKLVNFRPGSVDWRFVSTRLERRDRIELQWVENGWDGTDPGGSRLRATLAALFGDWGAFLDAVLYQDALVHLLGGAETIVQPVDIVTSGRVVGRQDMCLLDPVTVWHLSAVSRNLDEYKVHLQRLLRHTRLARLHWINLHHTTITLKTLRNTP